MNEKYHYHAFVSIETNKARYTYDCMCWSDKPVYNIESYKSMKQEILDDFKADHDDAKSLSWNDVVFRSLSFLGKESE